MNILQAVKRKLRAFAKMNVKFDREVISIDDDKLETSFGKRFYRFNKKEDEFWRWCVKAKLDEYSSLRYPHKKALEFFFSAHLLCLEDRDVILDAAGGESSFLAALKNTFQPAKTFLHDHIYDATFEKDGSVVIGGDISQINLPAKSVNKISCHHSFEHFKNNKDSEFVGEIGRLLIPGGKAVIIPLFVSNEYYETWNTAENIRFESSAKLLVDTTASLPGGKNDGNFARIYSPDALKRRVLSEAKKAGMNYSIVTCTLDDHDVPDMMRNKGAKINCPLRALVMEKTKK